MTVSDDMIALERLSEFVTNLGKLGLIVTKMMAKNVLRNPGRAVEIRATVGTEFASRSPKAAQLSLTEAINFYHTGKGLYLGKFVSVYTI